MRAIGAKACVCGLAVLAVAIIEGTLFAFVMVCSYVLGISLVFELGSGRIVLSTDANAPLIVQIYSAGVISSIAICTASGLGAATKAFRSWRPAGS